MVILYERYMDASYYTYNQGRFNLTVLFWGELLKYNHLIKLLIPILTNHF